MEREFKNWKNFLQEACWQGYEQQGMKKKGDRMVPNCVPISEEEALDENGIEDASAMEELIIDYLEEHGPSRIRDLRRSLQPKETHSGSWVSAFASLKKSGRANFYYEPNGPTYWYLVDKHHNLVPGSDPQMSWLEEEEMLDENGIPLMHVHKEGKICPKGKAWAMRKYGKWSAYAAMGASKYCKDPNYGKGKKKDESLHNEGELKKWREENWVQSDGTPCGDAKAQKNPKRCKPASKWASMSKGEKKADDAKKKAGGKKGKQFVSATKKGKVTKRHTKESKNMDTNELKQLIREVIEGTIYYHIPDATYDDGTLAEDIEFWDDVLEEAEYQGRKVTLNKPMQGDVKKSKVYVKNAKGNVVKVNFGDPNMKIRKSNPKARKSFRARHNCDNPGPKWKARYWSCRAW
jgi:hypothetical protein